MLLRLIVFAIGFSGMGLANSGTIEILGSGDASSPPEYATLTVTTVSICYNTSKAAKDANAVLANRLLVVLRSFARGEKDKVTALGGPNIRATEYIDAGSGERRILCERKWRATNTLKLETGALEELADIQDQLLSIIDAEDISGERVAQTYAQLSEPHFAIREDTQKKLRTDAQKLAWQDAKAQFDAFASQCPFKNPKLTTISPPSYSIVPRFGREGEAMEARTPLIPEELSVTATWRFVWTFEPSQQCSLPR